MAPCLSGCATRCAVQNERVIYVPQLQKPPVAFLTDCEIPTVDVSTNGDLLLTIIELLESNRKCAAKITGINRFFSDLERYK